MDFIDFYRGGSEPVSRSSIDAIATRVWYEGDCERKTREPQILSPSPFFCSVFFPPLHSLSFPDETHRKTEASSLEEEEEGTSSVAAVAGVSVCTYRRRARVCVCPVGRGCGSRERDETVEIDTQRERDRDVCMASDEFYLRFYEETYRGLGRARR